MIGWFVRNGVAANLLMALIIGMGFYAVTTLIPLEVFPQFELNRIQINVPFRGATPVESEQGVVVKVEEVIHDLEGIKEMRSQAAEGVGSISIDVEKGYDPRALLDDIKNRVDAISTFPQETERPIISLAQYRREVISVAISGDLPERELRQLGERVRDDIRNLPGISQVELGAVRPYEVSIEVSETTLDQYGLSFDAIATAINNSSLDLSAGTIRTRGGEILVRTKGQAYVKEDFEDIVVVSRNDGTRLTLADIAEIKDGFEENPVQASFNNQPSVMIEVYRVGDQDAIELAKTVKGYIALAQAGMPPGVTLNYWRDRSRIVKARLNTLTRSALQGGILIFLLLALFLRFSVAVWVCVGIPVSFLGALALMPVLGVSINIISLFAFILVLGIVVDDAIVTGENIYSHLQKTGDSVRAAIEGTHEVAIPVTFGVLTTVAAFLPLAFVEGHRGQIFAQIPLIVIPVLLFSLVESKLILPSHLSHLHVYGDQDKRHNALVRLQRRIARGLENYILKYYRPVLSVSLRNRYLTLSVFIGIFILLFSLVMSGRVGFVFFPRVQSETARASLTMAVGTPFEVTTAQIQRIALAAEQLRDQYIDPETNRSVIKDILATSGYRGIGGVASSRIGSSNRSNIGQVTFEIISPEHRTLPVTSSELVREWRKMIGNIPGAEELTFRAEIGRGGDPIDIQLSGADFDRLTEFADLVKARLQEYPDVFDISDSFDEGKEEIQLAIKPEAELLGLTMSDLARQVRQAFFGEEVQRIQRGREDVRVMVRYPEQDRHSVDNLESMRIRTDAGVAVPFADVARVELSRGYATINRINRHRTVNVTADVNKESVDIEAIKRDLLDFLAQTKLRYADIHFSLEGEAKEQRESFSSLSYGLLFVLFIIYALLAIPFRSYVQPLIVMSVIPFGMIGAVLGHMMLGMNLSIMSLMGMLALMGVVVNDSLVLVDYVNRRRREGITLIDAVRTAGVARFRPVLLTSLTTFVGLTPLILEKSTQAQFLIPMAVSLGFGILFATFITLLLIPVNYMILEDIAALVRGETPGLADSSSKAEG